MFSGKFIGCSGNIQEGSVTLKFAQPDGLVMHVALPADQAAGLIPSLQQATNLVLAAKGIDPSKARLAQQFPVQSVHFGHNTQAKIGALVIDKDQPSQITYLLNEQQTWNLAAGVSEALKSLSVQPRNDKH